MGTSRTRLDYLKHKAGTNPQIVFSNPVPRPQTQIP